MKVPLSWLREFAGVTDSAEEVARTMSLRGFAVEGIEPIGQDAVLDFEVTANRPDCMSIVGMAREIAVAYGLPLKSTSAANPPGSPGGPQGSASYAAVEIVIEDPQLCPRYVGAVADVTVGPSPSWMQSRLQAAGIRPISNIVDVTNYVLLELGHPMHAFDFTRLAKAQIRVRTARGGETIKTLDGHTRTLSPEMLVIADAERPVAIAGVMGGAESEVSDATRTIVLESAYFNPLSVRRTSKKLGLKTEASMRFERGADPALAAAAMARAISLVGEIGAGKGRGRIVDEHPAAIAPRVLQLRRERLRGLLGGDVPDGDVRAILSGLGFELGDPLPALAGSAAWEVTVPTRRVDVTREVDLIEEVARHYGFDRLPVTFPELTHAPQPPDPRIMRARQLRSVLAAAGFSEALTFGFISEPAAAAFAAASELVPIANPLSENYAVLRPSVLPGLVDAIAHNRRREQHDVRLFEIGARFSQDEGERRAIACAWTGAADREHWSARARPVDFFDMTAVVDRVSEAVGAEIHLVASADAWLAPGRRAQVMANGTRVGAVGQLAAAVADNHGLVGTEPVYVAELDLDGLEAAAAGRSLRVEPLPRYPSVTRDISILVDDTLAAADLRATVRDSAPAILVRVAEFDRYEGKGVPEGRVSLSLRLTFRSSDRTLTDAEVQTAMDAVMTALKNRHAAVQR